MKNLFSILILTTLFFFTSCSKDLGTNDQEIDYCNNSNGYISASISGSDDIGNACATGSISEITGINLLIGTSTEGISVSSTEIIYKNYLLFTGSMPSAENSGCISDYTDMAAGSFIYVEDLRINPSDSAEGYFEYYVSVEESMEVCFETLTSNRAKGTFSGTLRNEGGDEKYVTDGKFDFEF
jgi:hypothetical protein